MKESDERNERGRGLYAREKSRFLTIS